MGALLLLPAGCRDNNLHPSPQTTMHSDTKLDHPAILQVLFHPRPTRRIPAPANSRDLDLEVDQNVILGCRLHVAGPDKPSIILFHGNGEIVADYDGIAPFYTERGMNLLVTDYRGYGWSSGSPTVTALLLDSVTLFEKITKWLPANGFSGPVFLMGRSLGSACAIDLAARYNQQIKGLIIESGFAATLPLAKTLGLDLEKLGVHEADCFQNEVKITSVSKPTFILHGQRDTLIPVWHAHRLHAESGAKSKELQIVPGAEHNTLIAVGGHYYFNAIQTFVDKVSGNADWRKRRKAFKEAHKQEAENQTGEK